MLWTRNSNRKLCVTGGKVTSYKIYGKEGYKQYLSSIHWKLTKEKAKKIFGSKCLNCQSDIIDFHHLTYKNRGREKSDEIIPLCRKCHQKIHKGEIKI